MFAFFMFTPLFKGNIVEDKVDRVKLNIRALHMTKWPVQKQTVITSGYTEQD